MKPNDKPCMDVWEDNTKVPKLHSYIVATNSVGDTIYGKANVHSGNQFYIMENSNFHIKKWCYLDDLLNSHNELQTKVAMLEKALKFYADESNWRTGSLYGGDVVFIECKDRNLWDEPWTVAQKAIAEITKTKE